MKTSKGCVFSCRHAETYCLKLKKDTVLIMKFVFLLLRYQLCNKNRGRAKEFICIGIGTELGYFIAIRNIYVVMQTRLFLFTVAFR